MRNLFFVLLLVLVVTLASCLPPPDSFESDPVPVDSVFVLYVSSVFASGDDGNVPQNTLDGNLSTRWSSSGVGEWITFELNNTFEVQSINISWYVGDVRVSFFDVLYSEDGLSWVNVYSGESSGTSIFQESYGLIDAAARYVRIVGKGNNLNSWNSITTVTILGKNVDANTLYLDYSLPVAVCGNGVLEAGEECDNGSLNGVVCTPPIGGTCAYCSNDCKNITLTDTSVPVQPPSVEREKLSLRGDPDFNPNSLSIEARGWYDRFWYAIKNDRASPDAIAYASSDNLYNYARGLNQHMLGLFTAFRATGDLKILDEIDVLAELMRAELYDGWCNNLGGKDGYLNWRYMRNEGSTWYCKDIHVMEEMLTHGHVAQIAYAYHVNRDMESPGGIDYSERADFWTDYLENHFEAKWRARNKVEWPRMNFLTRTLTHPHVQFFRYHYYMYKITGKEEYRKYAESLIDNMIDSQRVMNSESGGLMEVQTPLGTGIIWAHRAYGWDSSSESAQPYTYIRYTIGSISDLAFEDFYRFDDVLMDKIGVSVAYFVMDTDPVTNSSLPFASSIIGDEQLVSGSWSINPLGDRGTNGRYATSTYAWPMPFMKEGAAYDKMRKITLQSYNAMESNQDMPRRSILPAILLTDAVMRDK